MPASLTLAVAFDLYLADCKDVRKNTDSTLRARGTRMAKFFRFQNLAEWRVNEVGCDTINAWTEFSHKKLGMEGNGRIYIRKQILAFFSWLEEKGHIPLNPLDTRKLVKIFPVEVQRPPITHEQHLKLLTYFTEHTTWEYWHDACIVGWHTGLRLSDVAGLLWSEVNFSDKLIVCVPKKTKRFNKTVTVPMEPEVYDALDKRCQSGLKVGSPLVFPIMQQLWASNTAFAMLPTQFRRACVAVGIPERYSFHSYRHAFISRLLCAGVNVRIIQSMTGQSLDILYKYVTVCPDAQREALEKARPRLGDKL
jgi:integrase